VVHQYDVTDPWWDQFDYVRDDEPIAVPSLYIETWGDFTARPTLFIRDMYARTAANETARRNQKVIIAPGSHCVSEMLTADMQMGEVALGDPRFGHVSLYLDWYRQWLRGEKRGVEKWPAIQYFVIGRNEWRASEQWPPEGVVATPFYFHSAGRANSHNGDGTLSLNEPGEETADEFVYDPATPVPSAGGPYSSGVGAAPYMDQRPVSIRSDVLVYTSDVLENGLEITGPVDAVLHVSSSVPDTDFSVKLVDVAPDGTAVNVRVGFIRARYREGREKHVFMKPGQTYRIPVSLNDIAWWFKPGHRLRVQVTSSDFPSYARNLNTGGRNFDETEWQVARNSIHHSTMRASHIVLPVVAPN
jgi:putative CocE/NonD family hydrolase